MEKEGLIRAVMYLHEQNLSIGTLITDRHPAIQKWVRETFPEATHLYDVWHVAKGWFNLGNTLFVMITLEHAIYISIKG